MAICDKEADTEMTQEKQDEGVYCGEEATQKDKL
jgi:hypothetical protein